MTRSDFMRVLRSKAGPSRLFDVRVRLSMNPRGRFVELKIDHGYSEPFKKPARELVVLAFVPYPESLTTTAHQIAEPYQKWLDEWRDN